MRKVPDRHSSFERQQKRIRSLIGRNNDKMTALIALVTCFNSTKLNNVDQIRLSKALQMAQDAIDFEQKEYRHATDKAIYRLQKEIKP